MKATRIRQIVVGSAYALVMAAQLVAAGAVAGEPAAAQPAVAPPSAAVPTISQDALLQRQQQHSDPVFVLDVRTADEFAAGHVPGAVNISHDQLASRLAEVPKDKEVVLYCRSGRRAGLAADVLHANGYTRLSHLEGDMQAWVANGRPIAKP
jgi:rhodanese-related sulfurtransferase